MAFCCRSHLFACTCYILIFQIYFEPVVLVPTYINIACKWKVKIIIEKRNELLFIFMIIRWTVDTICNPEYVFDGKCEIEIIGNFVLHHATRNTNIFQRNQVDYYIFTSQCHIDVDATIFCFQKNFFPFLRKHSEIVSMKVVLFFFCL